MAHKVYFISDLHLGHQKVITFAKERQKFKTTREMGDYLIERWNSVVLPEDKVIVLGDICLNVGNEETPWIDEEVNNTLSVLNGTKICVKGNHDVGPTKKKIIDAHFKESLGCYEYKEAVCTHIPIHPQQLHGSIGGDVYRKWKWNIHGHLHEYKLYPPDDRYINVSCDVVDFTPRTYEELVDERREQRRQQAEEFLP